LGLKFDVNKWATLVKVIFLWNVKQKHGLRAKSVQIQVKFYMQLDYKRYMKQFYMLSRNMATMRNFDNVSGKFNMIGIYTNVNYACEFISKLCNSMSVVQEP